MSTYWMMLALASFLQPPPQPMQLHAGGSLIIQVDNIKKAEGFLWIGIYDSEDNFLVKEKAIVEGIEVTRTGSVQIKFPSLPYGTYAIAMFHDLNGNDELDRNRIGIPTEPYAFSGDLRSKWRLPNFSEVSVAFKSNGQKIHFRLQKWWE